MLSKSFSAWAISIRQDGKVSFIGRYWFSPEIPVHLEGCRIALFDTRRLARQHLPDVKLSYKSARVRRVAVFIEVAP